MHTNSPKQTHSTIHTYTHIHRAPCGSVYTQHTLKLRKADDKKDAATKGSELYIRTLLQGSSFSIPNEEFITARAKRWKHYMKLEKPVCDRVYAPFNGDTVTRYPSDSGAFTPFVEEESLKK